jgi:uncharacterized protein with von Willebrand factor type A (vWA) domain
VPVGLQEIVGLASALAKGLHESSLDEFYYVARSILIHDESKLDVFDQVFSFLYQDVPYDSKSILDELLEWLQDPLTRPVLSDEEKSALEVLNPEELQRLFEERLREQKERHDGGDYWIGTGGRSPFGTNGYHPSGMSLKSAQQSGPGGGRSILRTADARRYHSYRDDLVMDMRHVEVALRKLRSFDRNGAHPELDLDQTIDITARNFGDLELVFRKPRRPNTRVILLMDVGGSMDPYATLVSQLFSASRRATHWKELRTYYFHNCIYGRVFRTNGLQESVSVRDLLRECDARYKLIIVGDASMAPSELFGSPYFSAEETQLTAFDWFQRLRNHFANSIWLNPDGLPTWGGTTVDAIAQVFTMFPLTLAGLGEGLSWLQKSSSCKR